MRRCSGSRTETARHRRSPPSSLPPPAGSIALARGDVAAAVAAAAVPLDRDPALAETTFCDLLLAVRAAARLAGGDAPGALTLFEHVGARQAQLSGASVPLTPVADRGRPGGVRRGRPGSRT